MHLPPEDRTWADDVREMNERETLPMAQPRKVKAPPDPAKQAQGRSNKRKGNRGEREVVKALEPHAVRGFGDRIGGDVRLKNEDSKIEVKCEKAPFKRLYKLIEGHYAVAFRGNNQEWLLTLRLKDFKALLDELEGT